MLKNIPSIYDTRLFKLFFGVLIGLPIIGFGIFFGITGLVSLFSPLLFIFSDELSLPNGLEHDRKAIRFIFLSVVNGCLGISGFIGSCGIAIRIHKTYIKLSDNHVQTIRFMLFCGKYASLGAVMVVMLSIEFEDFKKIVSILIFFLFSFITFTFCILATPIKPEFIDNSSH